jgi:hypothetical protein
MPTELRLLLVLGAMLTLPGWALLAISRTWRQWHGLQRWIVAAGLSIAFFPVLFYGIRCARPFLTLGPYKMAALLLAMAAVVAWRMRRHWREQFAFDRLEWAAIGVFGVTLFTRFWVIREHPFPAWSDSLHHTLLTQLTAVQGALPADMEPYFPVRLQEYHLGLYSLSATVQWLAQVPAHTALLWTAQALNGLCGLGIYLVLDRRVGRAGAVVGATTVGLLAHQPAFYVNWGRFTQIASQSIVLIAWIVTWEAMSLRKHRWQESRVKMLWNTALAALLTGAVFLLHFRVAVFYLPLILASALIEVRGAQKEGKGGSAFALVLAIGVVTLVVVAPALWSAAASYLTPDPNQMALTAEELSQTTDAYYGFRWNSVPYLIARPWLLVLAVTSAVIGLATRNRLIIGCILWTVALYLLGNAHVLGLPALNITNLGAVLIMLYLPIGLAVGAAAQECATRIGPSRMGASARLVAAVALGAVFVASHVRVADTEPYRFFVTPQDLQAMDWIRENTPPDAVFAVNTYFWLPTAPHGTDAGYWIPYFAGRKTTLGPMIFHLGSADYVSRVVETSRIVEQLEVRVSALAELQALGVDYVYVGHKGDFSGPGLDAAKLRQAESTTLLYENGGVSVFRVGPP